MIKRLVPTTQDSTPGSKHPQSSTVSPKARRKARVFGMQALYQSLINPQDISNLIHQYRSANDHHRVDWEYFGKLVNGVQSHLNQLDQQIQASSDRPLAEMTPIELCLIRLAVFEMLYCQLHPNIVMDEYIEITHDYGTEEGYRFVNGILDKCARTIEADHQKLSD